MCLRPGPPQSDPSPPSASRASAAKPGPTPAPPARPPRSSYLDPARELALTCQQFYNRTATRLAPEIAFFDADDVRGHSVGVAFGDMHVKQFDAHCLLRPEAVESWFVLHRVTGEERYREWGWDFARALERHARVKTGGYTSLDNVMSAESPGTGRDKMESFFLAVRPGFS